jgi:response regulator RpfG family c-di-GMP phosphodiesterase
MSFKDFQKTGHLRTTDKLKSLGLLVVDDERGIVESLTESFRSTMHVYAATSGEEALRLFKEKDIHIVVSDQRMPEMTGVDLLARIKEIDPVPVRILITGYSDIQVVIRAVNDGLLWKYLTKPWVPDELRQVVIDAGKKYLLDAGIDRPLPHLLGM